MADYGEDYLLDKRVKIFQPDDGYRASVDAVFLSALVGSAAPCERILDIGSGTGAVSLCLAHRFPACEITGLEIQPRLVELSSLSAAANGFANLRYLNRDIRRPLPDIANCSFHHVITNPPYAEHDMPSPNPGKAFAHNFRQFDLASWIAFALKMMRPKGHFYMINRTEAVTEILSALRGKAGAITIVPLYSKKGQDAKRVLVSARKDSKAPARILPGLVVHNDDGSYSAAAERILRGGECLPNLWSVR